MRKSSQATIRASIKYNQSHTKQINFSFNLATDADILEKLESVPNKQGYIKQLIRADMERSNHENLEQS